jgi:hypothetical protein
MTTWNDIAQANKERLAELAEPVPVSGFDSTSPVEASVTQRDAALKDAQSLGTGFLVDGVRVEPSRVVVIRGQHFPHVTTAELWAALEGVLRDHGAQDDWIEYALPALQVAATQYAAGQWAKGHEFGVSGEPIPNGHDTYTRGVEPMPGDDLLDGFGHAEETTGHNS